MKPPSFLKKTGYLLKETFREFVSDNALQLSAALSYYTIFSLPPLLIIIISLSGIFFGAQAANGEVFEQIKGLVGDPAALQIQEAIKKISLSGSNVFITTIGVIILIIGASGVFSEIQDSINYIWGIKTKHKHGWIKFLKNRLMSFSMIGSVGILLFVALLISSLMDLLNKQLILYLPDLNINFYYTISTVIVLILITILFTVIFKILPDGKISLLDCLVGAAFTAVLFMIGKFAIGAYLGSSSVSSIYGAAGSLVLILAWVYYSAIILYFGAEFTKVYAHTHGDKITPNEYSVLILKK